MLAADPDNRPSMAQAAQVLAAVHAAVADPAAIAPTQRMDAPPPTVPPPTAPPPSTTATLPPVRTPRSVNPILRKGPHAARNAVIAIVALLLLGGAILLATQLGGSGHPGASGSNSPAAAKPTSHQPSQGNSSRASANAQTSAPTIRTNSQSQGAAPPAAGNDQIAAVTTYYGLLPGNTAAAWDRLTSGYQAQTGGRASYDSFWHSFRSVEVSNPRTHGGIVLADLRYVSTTGAVSTETRSFDLVREAGILKIAASSVVNG